MRVVGYLCAAWLFYAFREHIYQLGDRLHKVLEHRFPQMQQKSNVTKAPRREDWPEIGFNICVFLALYLMCYLVSDGLKTKNNLAATLSDSEIQARQVTLPYWQATVANLHPIRFQTPSDTESAKGAFERLTRELKQRVQQARAASTDNVDSDLVSMVRRHLELDNRMLSTLSQIPQLMKQHQIPVGTETAYQGALQWEEILARLRAQPELWEKLPPEAQQLINDIVEIEHQQQEQFREIEIQQAVLQERYRGMKFPLPEIPQ